MRMSQHFLIMSNGLNFLFRWNRPGHGNLVLNSSFFLSCLLNIDRVNDRWFLQRLKWLKFWKTLCYSVIVQSKDLNMWTKHLAKYRGGGSFSKVGAQFTFLSLSRPIFDRFSKFFFLLKLIKIAIWPKSRCAVAHPAHPIPPPMLII